MSDFWSILINSQISSFKSNTVSQNNSMTNWSGNGSGSVNIEISADQIYLTEIGRFNFDNGKSIATENEYLFVKNLNNTISLSHTRFGRNKPVFLFDIIFAPESNKWLSIEPHLCVKDYYSCEIYTHCNNIHLNWQIIGPQKNESIKCIYS